MKNLQRTLVATALAAFSLAAGACAKKGSNASGGGSTPQEIPDPPIPPKPVIGYCYGVHGCTAQGPVQTTREVCEEKGGQWEDKPSS